MDLTFDTITKKFLALLVAVFIVSIAFQLMARTTVHFEVPRAPSVRGVHIFKYDHCDYMPFDFLNSSKYVSLCADRMLGNTNGNGNHLFILAALVYVAQKTGRIILVDPSIWCLDKIFNLRCLPRYQGEHSTIPGPQITMETHSGQQWMSLDERLGIPDKHDKNGTTAIETFQERTILLCGQYQTRIYAEAVSGTLRRLLQFRPEVNAAADKFVRSVRQTAWTQSSAGATIVGVHVRRGDYEPHGIINDGYLYNAMQYFISRHQHVHFLMVSTDQDWVEKAVYRRFPGSRPASGRYDGYQTIVVNETVVVTQSFNQSAAVDMAILTLCDGMVVSTGSYGWWAAWIANKPTVYYENWPTRGSELDAVFARELYFPKSWVPLN